MQAIFKDGTFGDPLDYDEKLMFELLNLESVAQVKVYHKGAETAEISNLLPKTSPLDMKSIELLIQEKIDENESRRSIYKEYFELTGEMFKRKGLLEPPFMINRKHY